MRARRRRDVTLHVLGVGTLAGVLALAACHGEPARTGKVPIDTAAAFPAPESLGLGTTDTTQPAPPGSTTAPVVPPPPTIVYRSDSTAGYAIYHGRGRCFTCHGQLGEGTPHLGPALTDSTWVDGDGSLDSIRSVIANGVAVPRQFPVAMPAYAGTLRDADIADVAAYIYAISHSGVTLPDSFRPDTAGAVPDTDSTRASGAPQP